MSWPSRASRLATALVAVLRSPSAWVVVLSVSPPWVSLLARVLSVWFVLSLLVVLRVVRQVWWVLVLVPPVVLHPVPRLVSRWWFVLRRSR